MITLMTIIQLVSVLEMLPYKFIQKEAHRVLKPGGRIMCLEIF